MSDGNKSSYVARGTHPLQVINACKQSEPIEVTDNFVQVAVRYQVIKICIGISLTMSEVRRGGKGSKSPDQRRMGSLMALV